VTAIPLRDDQSSGIGDVGVNRQGFVGDEIRIGGSGELNFAVDVIEVAKRHITQVRATITGVAEAVGALWLLGIDVGEEPAGVPVWGEEFDDGLGIEIESGASRCAGGAAVGE
jgi:hypothetical protein